jgi:hypothetical protein
MPTGPRHGVLRVRQLCHGLRGPLFSSMQSIYQQQQYPSHQPGPEV